MRGAAAIAILAVCHLLATGASLLSNLSYVMGRFEAGGAAGSGEWVVSTVQAVLFFPIGTLMTSLPGPPVAGLLGWVPFVLNSALWASVMCFGFRLARDISRKTRGSPE